MSDFITKTNDIFKKDLLERQTFAEALFNLISKSNPVLQDNKSLVVAIDAPWGTGKTFFLELFEESLFKMYDGEENAPVVVKYNAWKNDDFEKPVQSLLHALVMQQANRDDIKEKWSDRGKKLLEDVAVPALLQIIRKKTGFDAKKAFEIAKGVMDVESQKTFEKFEEAVRAKKMFSEMMGKLSINNKVIVLIDELDRCRPTYAIELLETIKHYFNVENYIFIFALDKTQLSHSLKTLYGAEMDSQGYLRRFFDYILHFPIFDTKKYCEFLLQPINMESIEKNNLINEFLVLVNHMELSCRDINIVLTNFMYIWEIILKSQTLNYYMMISYILLVALKYKYPREYRKLFGTEALTGADINNLIELTHKSGIINKIYIFVYQNRNKNIFEMGKYISINQDEYSRLYYKDYTETLFLHKKDHNYNNRYYAKLFHINEGSDDNLALQLTKQLAMIDIQNDKDS